MLKRSLNVGFSGGEKKRMEALQMAILKPDFTILDEADSGLDIDAIKVVANSVNNSMNKDKALLIITHYQKLLTYIKPDFVHIYGGSRIWTLYRYYCSWYSWHF
jgi:Fe-S cluster assembly ATP-binding protein